MFKQEDILKIMNEQLQTDEIKEYVANKVKKTIKDSIDYQFSDYKRSDKDNDAFVTIDTAVREAIGLNLKELKLPEFQTMLINTINASLLSTVSNEAKENLEKNISRLLIADKKEYSLNELFYDFLDENDLLSEYQEKMDDEFNPDYDDCTLKAKDINLSDLCSSNLIDISLKRSSEYSDWLYIEFQRKCRSSSSIFLDYQITVWKSKNEKEYRLSSMRVAGKDFKEQTLFKDVPRRFDALMFKIFNESVKLVITDEDLKYFDEK
jgi:hypothetical protein